MKKFLKNLVIYSLPFLVFVLFFEIYLRQLNTSYSEKARGLIENRKKIELIIFGNSHEAYGINPNEFDVFAYNMAQVTQSLYFDKRIAIKYIDDIPNLKYAIIGLDFHSFYFSSQTKMRDLMSYYGYGIEYKDQIPFEAKLSRLNGYSRKVAMNLFTKDFSHKYDKIKAIDVEEGVDLNKTMNKGWFYFKQSKIDLLDTTNCKERATYFNNLGAKSVEKNEIISDFEDFIIQLKKRKIKPIFVTIPCYSVYTKMLDKRILIENKLIINSLCNKYKIKYFDYFNLGLSKDCYKNCDHLNYKGATIFSKMLNSRISEK